MNHPVICRSPLAVGVGVGVGDSLRACQRRARDAFSVGHASRLVQTRTWGWITKRSARLFAAVRSPGRGTEACAVISVHASALMCVSSNYLLAPAPRLKITSPSRQLINCRKSRSDWFSLNCRSRSSGKVLTKPKKPFFKRILTREGFWVPWIWKTSIKMSMKGKLVRLLEVKSLGSFGVSVSSPRVSRFTWIGCVLRVLQVPPERTGFTAQNISE